MSTLRLEDLKQYSDTLRTRDGTVLSVRFVEPRDTDELQHYFRSLSTRSRYNRFFGAISELPKGLLHDFLEVGEHERFTVVATKMVDGFETIVAEARYALQAEGARLEFGLSVDDRWQGHGIATALMKNLECRAAALGAEHMFGDTLRSNEAMVSLARKSGFAFVNHPDDWKLVRFAKEISVAPNDIPCASWRLAALSRQAESPSASA
ncbi:GNAT family acetyltransferase [Bradyrhizobium sacchari]|uniref:Acetyltransferase (GNAT) family protein n=1 Tax=Bradyrhizobium sacchari TaxID=1399419 RepID=A0A560KGD1_9BRAD|nr:GNAT family N-acetyltransferase [Bradyrhizobium sacchari]OPZ00291.1 GNAT family acetyltransferase [Bradyrhizobium sacchari]TWB64690.1 acetyltransferase (GNAT) family protein [Bradyrhizobium sacchari]TWB81014.1 acetyltransferase (GNAT) family protein [Bradyrhizobium sacchari]